MKHILLFLTALSFLLAACQRDNAASVRAQIEAGNAKLTSWYATGQIDSVADMFTADARQMGPNSPPVVGREAIRRGWEKAVSLGVWTFRLNTREVTVSGSLAVERGTYTIVFTPGPNAPARMVAPPDKGNYLAQWRLDNGKWRIANYLATSELPR